jgi:hypothetical protein
MQHDTQPPHHRGRMMPSPQQRPPTGTSRPGTGKLTLRKGWELVSKRRAADRRFHAATQPAEAASLRPGQVI